MNNIYIYVLTCLENRLVTYNKVFLFFDEYNRKFS